MEEVNLTKKERRTWAKEEKKKEASRNLTYDRLKKLLIVAFGVFILVFAGFKTLRWITTPTPEIAGVGVEVQETDWVEGKMSAPISLIEYSDFQCPACATYSPLVKKLLQEYPENLKVVYRHFPLVSIHKNALPAAKAAEAAGKQGKFWEMHDILFERQDDWTNEGHPKEKFIKYAKELELGEDIFLTDYESGEVEDKVKSHLNLSNQLGLNATPTFFINGERVRNLGGYETLQSLIEEELKKVSILNKLEFAIANESF